MSTTDVPLADDLIAALGVAGSDAPRAVAEAVVLEVYRRRAVASGHAARLLGMDKWDFIDWAGKLDIPYIDMTEEEWEREM